MSTRATAAAERLMAIIASRKRGRRTGAARFVLDRIYPGLHSSAQTLAAANKRRGMAPQAAVRAALAQRLAEYASRGRAPQLAGLGATMEEVFDGINAGIQTAGNLWENVIDPIWDTVDGGSTPTPSQEQQARSAGYDPSQFRTMRGGVNVLMFARRAPPLPQSEDTFGFNLDVSTWSTTTWLLVAGGVVGGVYLLTKPKRKSASS